MARTNANQKGKAGEREACNLLKELGYEARRSQQYSGVRTDDTSADIITSVPGVRFEIKRGYNDTDLHSKQMEEWIATAREETPENQSWAILRRKDYQQWSIIFEMGGIVYQSLEIGRVLKLISK